MLNVVLGSKAVPTVREAVGALAVKCQNIPRVASSRASLQPATFELLQCRESVTSILILEHCINYLLTKFKAVMLQTRIWPFSYVQRLSIFGRL